MSLAICSLDLGKQYFYFVSLVLFCIVVGLLIGKYIFGSPKMLSKNNTDDLKKSNINCIC